MRRVRYRLVLSGQQKLNRGPTLVKEGAGLERGKAGKEREDFGTILWRKQAVERIAPACVRSQHRVKLNSAKDEVPVRIDPRGQPVSKS